MLITEYNRLSDLELSNLIKEGDRSAYTEVFNRYNSLLYQHAFKKFRNSEEAKDIVQEIFFMLWDDREFMQPKQNLAGFLYTCMHRRLLDWIKHKKIEAKFVDYLQSLYEENKGSTDSLVREKQLAEIIKKEIGALPPRMREVFIMSRYDQKSHKEIAEELDISEESVRSHVKGALKILRVKLGILVYLMLLVWY